MPSTFKRGPDKLARGSKWLINFYDAEIGRRRTVTGFSDRQASIAMGEKLEKESARRAMGVDDPAEANANKPLSEHVTDFVAKLRDSGRTPRYVFQVESKLKLIAARTGAVKLADLDPVKVLRALVEHRHKTKMNPSGRPIGVVTKNEFIGVLRTFTRWCVDTGRCDRDPLRALRKLDTRGAQRAHPRRALSADEFGRLLEAAERRALQELLTVRRGANVGQLLADVKPIAKARARRLGKERRLAYLLGGLAGLRRSEAGSLVWGDVDLDGAIPCLRLRAAVTKSRRNDSIPLHPQLADELRRWRPARAKPEDRVLGTVPSMAAMRADLRLAGIDSGTRATGMIDYHSLRMTLSTLTAASGMSPRTRQALLRHTSSVLTDHVYMDERLLPVASELLKMPAIPLPTETGGQTVRGTHCYLARRPA